MKKCKKLPPNAVVFVVCMFFLLIGLCSPSLIKSIGRSCLDVMKGNLDPEQGKTAIEKNLSEEIAYHRYLMDIESVRMNLSGTRVVTKGEDTVVKADSGSLTEIREKVSDQDIEAIVEKISAVQRVTERSGASFLYCAAPSKEYYETNPSNAENCFKDNYIRFLSEMEEQQVPFLDLTDSFRKKGMTGQDIFFYTDHHWKPTSGFAACTALCEELEDRYGFPFNKDYTDLSQYTVKTYPDWFLGSKGKKVGAFFTFAGPDDFDLITPNFPTNLTVERPPNKEMRSGEFKDTVFYQEKMKKDYYNADPYVAYCGGNFSLQIVKNHLNPEGKKVLLIRDSFACTVAPFLSLQTSELHICDMRTSITGAKNKVNVEEYIREIHPDYVVVLFNGVTSLKEASEKFSFF